MLGADTVMYAVEPSLQITEDEVNPFGQRNVSRYFLQAVSSGNTRWNSGRLVGKFLGSMGQIVAGEISVVN